VGQRGQQVAHAAVVVDPADVLAHDAQPARTGHGADRSRLVPGQDAQQRGLARTVGSDERDPLAGTHAERHVVEQRTPVGQRDPDTGDVEMAHAPSLRALGAVTPAQSLPRLALRTQECDESTELLPQSLWIRRSRP
jgi:hypothetical protein